MKEAAISAQRGEGAPPGAEAPGTQQSLLFPSVFGKLDRSRRIHVFDAGPALPETVRFFSPFRCRLHFADLFDDPLVAHGPGDTPDADLARQFTERMAIPGGTRFDLCLLWDFPNYLEDRALKAFDAALKPYLHARTLGHGFAVRTSGTRLDQRLYGIEQPHLFSVRRTPGASPPRHPHPQAILINLMPGFDIDRGMLLPDGRLEVALTACADASQAQSGRRS